MQTHRAANRRKSSPSSRRTRRGRRELTKKKDIFTDRKCATPPTRLFRRYVQNIIRRYGIDRGLNFVLPRLGHQLSSEDSSDPVRVEWLQEVEWHRDFMESGLYDVYDLHGVWNQTALRKFFFQKFKKINYVSDSAFVSDSCWAPKPSLSPSSETPQTPSRADTSSTGSVQSRDSRWRNS